jgi:uncharacterized metal-binding protein YceD (DUF177 family)
MEFNGKINIRELEYKDAHIEASKGMKWVEALLVRSAPPDGLTGYTPEEWAAHVESFQAEMNVSKMGGDYLVQGSLSAKVPAPCARCGSLFQSPRKSDFKVAIHRLAKGSPKLEDDTGDPDYIFLEGDQIDLSELLAEQLIVLEPVREIPEKTDKSATCPPECETTDFSTSFDKKASETFEKTGQRIENSAFSALSELAQLKSQSKVKN